MISSTAGRETILYSAEVKTTRSSELLAATRFPAGVEMTTFPATMAATI